MIKIICTEEEKKALIRIIAHNNYECLFDSVDADSPDCTTCRFCLEKFIEWEVRK